MSLLDIQLKMEDDVVKLAKEKLDTLFKEKLEKGKLSETAQGTTLLKLSVSSFADSINKYVENHRNRGISRTIIKDYFEKDDYKALGYLILSTVINEVAAGNNKYLRVGKRIFEAVEKHILLQEFRKEKPMMFNSIDGMNVKQYQKDRQKMQLAKSHHKLNYENDAKIKIGVTLLILTLESAHNILRRSEVMENGKNFQVVDFVPEINEYMQEIQKSIIANNLLYKPMVVEPLDWTSIYDNGGYYKDNSLSFIKMNKTNFNVLNLLEKYDQKGGFDRLYKIINKLQKTKWQVNKRVFDVVKTIIDEQLINPASPEFNKKLYGDIPFFDTRDMDEIYPPNYDENIPGSKKNWYIKYLEIKGYNEINKSKALTFYNAFNLAEEYTQYDEFYYTYQLDFRSRLYPIQNVPLNPQATGIIKSLLQFKEGQILNESGLYWLKIHIANCYGKDKLSYDDRIKWFDDNENMIISIAKNPLDNLKYLGDEEPLMFLAGCFSYMDYLEGKEVTVPVALDATCSGIQIYSGLLLDEHGGKSVNVVGENREDIYEQVAQECRKILEEKDHPKEFLFEKEAQDGKTVIEVKNTYKISEHLKDKVTRTMVKRNVMTVPYSVTPRGMYFQLKDIFDEDKANGGNLFYKGEEGATLKLISYVTDKAIARVIKGSKVGQEFIVDRVKDYYNDKDNLKKPLYWITPMGFPVFQWYQAEKSDKIKVLDTNLRIKRKTNKINYRKQQSGVAPNFVHSLDASLLYMTVENCIDSGVENFWLIHDSFSVLPNDVEVLNKSFRRSYVKLFRNKPLKAFIEHIAPDYEEELPFLNTLKLHEVYQSQYIIS